MREVWQRNRNREKATGGKKEEKFREAKKKKDDRKGWKLKRERKDKRIKIESWERKCKWLFDLVVFYGILTLVGYLMPGPTYICINLYDL